MTTDAEATEKVEVVTFNFRFISGLEAKLLVDDRVGPLEILELVATLASPSETAVIARLAESRNRRPKLFVPARRMV